MPSKQKSMAPFGKTMPIANERLATNSQPFSRPDPETHMMQLWEKENTRQIGLNHNLVPLDAILHECNEGCEKTSGSWIDHHFIGELDDRGVRVAAATVQWLATNCGRGFLEEFFREAIQSRIHYDPELRDKSKDPQPPAPNAFLSSGARP